MLRENFPKQKHNLYFVQVSMSTTAPKSAFSTLRPFVRRRLRTLRGNIKYYVHRVCYTQHSALESVAGAIGSFDCESNA